MDCIFCGITQGHDPALVIDRNAHAVAFLPSIMEARGHTLIVPRAHFENLLDIDAPSRDAVLALAADLCRHYAAVIGATGFNVLHASGRSAQQSIPHFYLHLMPRFDGDGLDAWPFEANHELDRNEQFDVLRVR